MLLDTKELDSRVWASNPSSWTPVGIFQAVARKAMSKVNHWNLEGTGNSAHVPKIYK
jgi:hypothetical protein